MMWVRLVLLAWVACVGGEEGAYFMSNGGMQGVTLSGNSFEVGQRLSAPLEDPNGLFHDTTNDYLLYTNTVVVSNVKTTTLYRILATADSSVAPDAVATWEGIRPYGLAGNGAAQTAYIAAERQSDNGKGIRIYVVDYSMLGQDFGSAAPTKDQQVGSGTGAISSGSILFFNGLLYYIFSINKIGTVDPVVGKYTELTLSGSAAPGMGDTLSSLTASSTDNVVYASLTDGKYPADILSITAGGSVTAYTDVVPSNAKFQEHSSRGIGRKGVPLPTISGMETASKSVILCGESDITVVDLVAGSPTMVFSGAGLGPVAWSVSVSPLSSAPTPAPTAGATPTPTGAATPAPTPAPTGDTPVPTPAPTGDTPAPTPAPTGDTPAPTPAPTGPTPAPTPAPTGDTPAPTPAPGSTNAPSTDAPSLAPPTPSPPTDVPSPQEDSSSDNMTLLIVIIACAVIILLCICVAAYYLRKALKRDRDEMEQRMMQREVDMQEVMKSERASHRPPPSEPASPVVEMEPLPVEEKPEKPPEVCMSMKEEAIPPASPSGSPTSARDSLVYWQGLHSRPVGKGVPSHGPGSPLYQRVVRMYEVHAPTKMDTIPNLVNKYGEEALLKTLIEKFGPEPASPVGNRGSIGSTLSTPLLSSPATMTTPAERRGSEIIREHRPHT